MAMLYLTPVLPLGLVSYMCGTTSIALFDFAAAKIASLPLYLIYTFIGASAHSFIKRGGDNNDSNAGIGASVADEAKKLEENQYLLMSGLILSIAMMTLITRYIRKELMKVRGALTQRSFAAAVVVAVSLGCFCKLKISVRLRFDYHVITSKLSIPSYCIRRSLTNRRKKRRKREVHNRYYRPTMMATTMLSRWVLHQDGGRSKYGITRRLVRQSI